MDHVYWLARILGPLFTIMGIWMIVRNKDVMKVWISVKANSASLYMGGVLNLLIGLTVLSTYSEWSWHLATLITLVGWISVIRGLLVLFAPEWVMARATAMEPFSKVWAIIPLFFGLLISYLAFA